MVGGKTAYDHPEIDEFLARADEVLKECPTLKTSDPSTVISSATPAERPGSKKRGRMKSKSRSVEGPASRSA